MTMAAETLREYKQIEIDDKVTFDGFFKAHPPEISEYTFTNLFMWRNHYKFLWKIEDTTLIVISTRDSSKIGAFPPVGDDPASAMQALKASADLAGLPVELHRVPESFVHMMSSANLKADVNEDRDNWDYIYSSKDLATLEGPPFADIRKKLSRFKRDHDYEFQILDTSCIEQCLQMQEEWCGLKGCYESESLMDEHNAIQDMFTYWDTLKFTGGFLKEKQTEKIIGYTLGEELNPNTMVVHVEKANPSPAYFGAYQAINKEFAVNCVNGHEFINREQDVGEPGLRRAKESYNPVQMGKKYIIAFK
ncbi:MAG TPA: phosphatidylglycerol lysyltransferase domain-containing protein [Candidatus Lokiarchaeia archaeon]|nr:phosphatidylglycerol lysyltransferase domain-containing protein [Candidatus Lokiarchaeia archaeon]